MRKSASNSALEHELEIPIEEEVIEEIDQENNDKREKIARLYESIQLLKDTISTKILKELKSCKESCEDANTAIGEIHGDVKKS